jgi:hypothetical protein
VVSGSASLLREVSGALDRGRALTLTGTGGPVSLGVSADKRFV